MKLSNKPIWVLINNYVFRFAKLYNDKGVHLFAILDSNNCGDDKVIYSGYYMYEFDYFFIDDEHERRFVTFVESLSSNDIFLKTKLERACEDAVLYLQNHKKEK